MLPHFEQLKALIEAFAIVGILLLFFLHPAIRSFPAAGHRRMVFLILVLVFAAEGIAQLTTRNQYRYPQRREPFPFTRWAMFGGMTHDLATVSIYEYRGIGRDGSALDLNPARLFVTPNATVHFTKTHALASAILSDNAVESRHGTEAADSYARGLLNRHKACHPETPLSRIELWERTIWVQPGTRVPDPFTVPECRLIYSFNGD